MTIRDAVKNLERASDPGRVLAEAAEAGKVQMSPILKAVGIDPNNPMHQAALLICNKYGLDPLLMHVVVIPGAKPYITRDGLLAIAHRNGNFDGLTIDEQGQTPTHWTAVASVYRKDMSHPFTFPGRYPKSGGNAKFGPEMAIKVAESMALRRAFNVTGVPVADEAWDTDDLVGADPVDIPEAPVEAAAGEPQPAEQTLPIDD